MPLLSRGRKPRIHLYRAKPRICRRRTRRFIEVSVPSDADRADETLLLAPGVPAPGKRRVGGRPRKFRRGSGMPEADWELRPPILGLQPTPDELPFGMLLLRGSRAERPGVGASQAAGGFAHGATWPREDRTTGEYTSMRLSRYSLHHDQSGVGFFDSGGLFVSISTISSPRNSSFETG